MPTHIETDTVPIYEGRPANSTVETGPFLSGNCKKLDCLIFTEQGVQVVQVNDQSLGLKTIDISGNPQVGVQGEFIHGLSTVATITRIGEGNEAQYVLMLIDPATGNVIIPQGQESLPEIYKFKQTSELFKVQTKDGLYLCALNTSESLACYSLTENEDTLKIELIWGKTETTQSKTRKEIKLVATTSRTVDTEPQPLVILRQEESIVVGKNTSVGLEQLDPLTGDVIFSENLFAVGERITLYDPQKKDSAWQYLTGTVTYIKPLKLNAEVITKDGTPAIISTFKLQILTNGNNLSFNTSLVLVQVIRYPDGTYDMFVASREATSMATRTQESVVVNMNGVKGAITTTSKNIIFTPVGTAEGSQPLSFTLDGLHDDSAIIIPTEKLLSATIKGLEHVFVVVGTEESGEYFSQVFAVRITSERLVFVPITEKMLDNITGIELLKKSSDQLELLVFANGSVNGEEQPSSMVNGYAISSATLPILDPEPEPISNQNNLYLPLLQR